MQPPPTINMTLKGGEVVFAVEGCGSGHCPVSHTASRRLADGVLPLSLTEPKKKTRRLGPRDNKGGGAKGGGRKTNTTCDNHDFTRKGGSGVNHVATSNLTIHINFFKKSGGTLGVMQKLAPPLANCPPYTLHTPINSHSPSAPFLNTFHPSMFSP
jgi:hypothetical protein